MADERQASPESSRAALHRGDITARLHNAELIRNDTHSRFVSATMGAEPYVEIPRDSQGRTPGETYHYWCGVVDAYAHMLAELTAQEARR